MVCTLRTNGHGPPHGLYRFSRLDPQPVRVRFDSPEGRLLIVEADGSISGAWVHPESLPLLRGRGPDDEVSLAGGVLRFRPLDNPQDPWFCSIGAELTPCEE